MFVAEASVVVMNHKHKNTSSTQNNAAQDTHTPPIKPLQGDLAAVFEAMADGVNVYDKDGHILHTNRAYRALIGLDTLPNHMQLSPDERGQQLQLRDQDGNPLHEEQRPVHRILAGEILTGDSMIDMMIHTLDGRELYLDVTGAPTYDQNGDIQGGVLIFRDVTERRLLERRTQDALDALLMMAEELVQRPDEMGIPDADPSIPAKEVAQRLAELIRSVLACERVSITIVDPKTHALRSSAVVGLSPEQEQAWRERRSDYMLSEQISSPELNSHLYANEVIVLDMTKPPLSARPNPYGIQTMILAPMLLGSSLIGVLALDHGGKHQHYTQRDIALTKAVAKLAALVVERERLVQERAEAQANALALDTANRRMDEFIGIASHEIRTPLTSIKANIQLVQRQMKRLIEGNTLNEQFTQRLEPMRNMLERAARQVEVQNRLVSDLLDVSRIYADKLELRIQQCDITDIVRRTIADQSSIVAPRSIYLETPSNALFVMADADRVEQVLNNYLSNALKYSESSQPVYVCLEQRGESVRVSVRDAGPGLTPVQQQHIWERFYRVEGITVKNRLRRRSWSRTTYLSHTYRTARWTCRR
jgi:signal transduction histidine kinase